MVKALVLFSCCVALVHCSHSQKDQKVGPQSQLFYADYQKVWRASQIALENYPLRVNNMDKGLLETARVKMYKHWQPPHEKDKRHNGLTYNLKLKLHKGEAKGRDAVKVSVVKKVKLLKGFFADSEEVESDGFEEQVILYRIGREIKIEKLLEREQKKSQPQ